MRIRRGSAGLLRDLVMHCHVLSRIYGNDRLTATLVKTTGCIVPFNFEPCRFRDCRDAGKFACIGLVGSSNLTGRAISAGFTQTSYSAQH